MSQQLWTEVDQYFSSELLPEDAGLGAALRANAEAGLPAHDVSPLQGKLLELFVRMSGARNVLEIGTLGGYSTVWLARALPAGGRVTTLEIDAQRAEVAHANFKRCGVADRVDVRVGPALETLPSLQAEGVAPFDLVFIDADKPNNPHYLEWAIRLTRAGGVIVGDNVVRGGAVADAASQDANVVGVRDFIAAMGRDPRLSVTAIQTVGGKGYDGFALAIVLPS